MNSIINEKGRLFYLRRKKDLYHYFYVAPVFILIILFLFVLGAKNVLHLYFSFFLIMFLASMFIIAMLSITKKLNRTISAISLKAGSKFKFKTFKVLFLKSIVVTIDRNNMKLFPQKFQINNKEIEEGWIIKLNNKKLYLFKDFFNSDMIDMITKS